MYLAYHNAQQAAQELYAASEQGKPWLLCVGDGLADAAAHEEWRISRKDAANSVVNATVVGAGAERRVMVEQEATARRRSEAKFRHLVDEMPVGLCQVNADGCIYHRNHRFIDLFGYDEVTVPTLSEWWERAYPDPVYRQWVLDTWQADVDQARRLGQDILSREYRVTTLDGTLRYVQISGITFEDDFLAVFIDNTQKRLAELELARHHQHLERLAQYDALTGLANRSLFSDRLDQALLVAGRERTQLALLFIDLDRFKPVNDTYGHGVGDVLLKLVAERMLACVRESDTVARIGGDEFVVLLRPCDEAAGPARVAECLRDWMRMPFEVAGHTLDISCSIGIAMFPTDGTTALELANAADKAMYRAKELGRR